MDNSEDLLSIGEASEICRISVKTLRHYDKLGIIKPACVDPTNKYRYYSKSQLPFIIYVREMRLLGFSLSEILGCFELQNEENIFRWEKVVPLVDEKIAQIAKQIEKLLKIQQQFAGLKELFSETGIQDSMKSGKIKVTYIPSRIVAFSRARSKHETDVMSIMAIKLSHLIHENNLYHRGSIMSILHEDYRDLNCAEADIEVCWQILAEKPFKYPFIREIPAGFYTSTIHSGDYSTLLTETCPVLYDWIRKHNYRVTGPAIRIHHVSIQNAQSPEQYLTEVQIPVIDICN